MLVRPFRGFGHTARGWASPPQPTYSRNSLPVQSSWSAEVSPLLVLRSHFAVGRFLGCVVFLRPAASTTFQRPIRPLFGFRVPPESYHRDLVRQPQPTDSSRGLLLPSAHSGSEVHFTRARPPATFRPQGLATLSTAYSLRAPAGLVSCRRRSWDSPFGAFSSRKVPTAFPRWMSPRTVSPIGAPARRGGWAGPTDRGFRAFTLPEVPGSRTGFNSPTTGCSLGFLPSRVLQRPA